MTERKFTDDEIIKALEHCGSKHTDNYGKYSCLKCPLFTFKQGDCSDDLHDFALDLINRQNEKLEMCESALERITKGLPEVKAIHNREIQQAKAEAIKEFAERLKMGKYLSGDWSHGEHPYVVEENDIDDLVCEMTEGENEC